MKIPFIYKKESNSKLFTFNGPSVELKEYQDDLVFYSSLGDVNRAEYALYDKIAIYENKPEIFTCGKFGSYLKINNSYSFDYNNFKNLKNEARISFYLSSNKIVEASMIALKKKDNFPENGLPPGDYSLTVTVEGRPVSTLVIRCTNEEGSNLKQIKNKILFQMDPMIYPFEINTVNNETDKILLQSTIEGKTLKISDGLQGTSLLDYFDLEVINYGTAPSQEIEIFKLYNLTISHFKNIEKGNGESYLRFALTGDEIQSFDIPWNNNAIDFDNIEIDFDENLIYIFINGELKKIEILKNKFLPNGQTLELLGLDDYQYSFDELIINNKCRHTKNFKLKPTQLTKYTTEKPYIDFYFAGNEIKQGMELITDCYNGIHACICDDGNYYYYNSGAWRRCTGDFNGTNDFATFSEKLKTFDFSGKDFFIRCYFVSNGTELSHISTLYFDMEEELYEDKDGNISAILVGNKEWNFNGEPTFENLLDKKLVIITDKGSTEIDFSENIEDEDEEESSSEIEIFTEEKLFDIDKTIEFINSYYPDGILKCIKDSKERVILVSETKGDNAFISVSGDAAPLIFGDIESAQGSDKDSGTIDYTKFYNAVRTYTGAPLISMEISDEQMRLFLKEALYYYKKWKGYNVSSYTCQLKGDSLNGYEIPSVVETQTDIIDIIFKPIFPITFYGSDFIDNGHENIFTLTMANYLLGGRGTAGGGLGNITQDFYISLMGMQDFKQTLGLNPKYEIMNNKLYIFPANVSRFTNVCIKYKSPISEEEAINNPDIIKYVHGKCLQAMSLIRSQYNGNLTAGDSGLTFDASWYDKGKQYVDDIIECWKKEQPPMGFFFG